MNCSICGAARFFVILTSDESGVVSIRLYWICEECDCYSLEEAAAKFGGVT